MIFVDTNYFLRFLLKDLENQHQKAKELFRNAACGKIKLFTSTLVFFEVYWVLTSYYEKRKVELISTFYDLLNLTFIEIKERSMLTDALAVFSRNNISLEDSYNLIFANTKGAKEFKTFDAKLAKLFTLKS